MISANGNAYLTLRPLIIPLDHTLRQVNPNTLSGHIFKSLMQHNTRQSTTISRLYSHTRQSPTAKAHPREKPRATGIVKHATPLLQADKVLSRVKLPLQLGDDLFINDVVLGCDFAVVRKRDGGQSGMLQTLVKVEVSIGQGAL